LGANQYYYYTYQRRGKKNIQEVEYIYVRTTRNTDFWNIVRNPLPTRSGVRKYYVCIYFWTYTAYDTWRKIVHFNITIGSFTNLKIH